MGVLSTCMSVKHVRSASEGQKRTPNPLELELGIVVSHHVGLGN